MAKKNGDDSGILNQPTELTSECNTYEANEKGSTAPSINVVHQSDDTGKERQIHGHVSNNETAGGGSNKRSSKSRVLDVCNLLFSTNNGRLEDVKSLHENGMDMSGADYDKRTALHIAAANGHEHIVRYLLEDCGISPHLQDRWGHTAISEATTFQHWAVVAYLMDFMAAYDTTHTSNTDDESPDITDVSEQLKLEYRDMYKKALKEGKEKQNTIRIMVVGHAGVGKSTLTRKLLGLPFENNIKSTNGIDVHIQTCQAGHDGKWEKQDSIEDFDHTKRLVNVALSQNEKSDEITIDDQRQYSCSPNTTTPWLQHVKYCSSCQKDTDEQEEMDKVKQNFRQSFTLHGDNISIENINSFSSHMRNTDNEVSKAVNIWDFGGQYIFYATHQLFHTKHAVYILVLDMSKELSSLVTDEDFPECSNVKDVQMVCRFWMNSIHSFAGNARGEPAVILVGTHMDMLPGNEQERTRTAEEYMKNVRELFVGSPILRHIQEEHFLVDTITMECTTLEKLRQYIVRVGEQQIVQNPEVPAKWIPLEKALLQRKAERHITLDDVCQIDSENEYPIGDREQIKLFLTFHHLHGTIIYFNEEGLSEFVVLDPQWIIDAFKCLISSRKFCTRNKDLIALWSKLTTEAILEHDLVIKVWDNHGESNFSKYRDILLMYLQKLCIISRARVLDTVEKELDFYIVPSLLRSHGSREMIESFLASRRCTVTSLVFKFEINFVCHTLYHRITSAALGIWDVPEYAGRKLLFENIGVYELSNTHAGMIEVTDNTIEITVVNMCGDGIDNVYSDKLRRFVTAALTHEFERFQKEEVDRQYNLHLRCYLDNKPGKKIKAIAKLESEYRVPCPDYTTNHVIDMTVVMDEWFPHVVPFQRQNSEKGTDILLKGVLKGQTHAKVCQAVQPSEAIKLSKCIGYNWELLGPSLGLSMATIDQIKLDHPKQSAMQIYCMLNTWIRKQGKHASRKILFKALLEEDVEHVDWERINNILDDFP